MFRTKTVFVVGAGASCELGFPSGASLLSDIASALDIRFGFGRSEMESGDSRVFAAFEEIVRQPGGRRGDPNPYLHSSWRVRDAAQLGLSIDNVINQLDNDRLVAVCAKIGIARQLLLAEQASLLKVDRERPDSVPLAAAAATWIGRFAQLLVQDHVASDLESIFDSVSIVSFNYDRSIRRFLPFALASQFGISEDDARRLTMKLEIFHPYGSLGLLPWETTDRRGIGFGDAAHASLTEVSASLRTFTEQIDDDELDDMRRAISNAERLVFLGFGYHRQNIELLTRGVTPSAKRIYGTALGLSQSDQEVVSQQLSALMATEFRHHFDPLLYDLGCVKFLDENFRTLVS